MSPSDRKLVPSLGELATESVRPELADLDQRPLDELVALLALDAFRAVDAVLAAAPAIGNAVKLITAQLAAGGRLVYAGAGTAGRIAVLDATELGPTFDVTPGTVEAVIAGGDGALRHAAEGAEDDEAEGVAAMRRLDIGPSDVVVGVSASGRTPFVVAALREARARDAATVAVTCNPHSPMAEIAEVAVETVVGGEIIAGSSRLNAGTTQKLVLNALSTATMVRLGKTYGNLMVDFRPTNGKLRDRAVRIVEAVTGLDATAAREALEVCDWQTKLACIVAATGDQAEVAAARLDGAGGRLREALDARRPPATRREGATRRLGVGAVFLGGRLVPGDVAIEDGKLRAIGLTPASQRLAVPGLVDLQVNGYAGVDLLEASDEEVLAMGEALARDGVLSYQPTLITSEPGATLEAIARLDRVASRAGRGARLLGVHLEGPFLSPERAGTHPLDQLRPPDRRLMEHLLSAGPVTTVTLAPELPGAIELIAFLRDRGVSVWLGHSAASSEVARLAVEAGARAVTHFFNAMAPPTARAPGLVGFALADSRVAIQLIADGVHVAEELLCLAFAAAPGRCSLVTDATSLAQAPKEDRSLGSVPISAHEGVARRPDGTIAGGTAPLVSALPRLAGLDLPLEQVIAAVTERPARLVGREDVGHLRLGAPANLLVLEDGLELYEVVAEGRRLDRS